MRLKDKVIVITGGARGQGRSEALLFQREGAKVILTDIDRPAGEALATELGAVFMAQDVSDEASVAHGFGTLHGTVKQIDVLVNNAGVGGGEVVEGSDVARRKRTLDTNLFGMYLVTRQLLPLIANEGRIVNLSSVLGRFGVPGYTAYCASKHGVIGFTRALSLEVLKRQITVNAISPGWVDTEMAMQGWSQGATHAKVTVDEFKSMMLDDVPIKRVIDPSEVAALVKFLCSKQAGAITGQTYNICGGQVMS